jgi:hypothetical protein
VLQRLSDTDLRIRKEPDGAVDSLIEPIACVIQCMVPDVTDDSLPGCVVDDGDRLFLHPCAIEYPPMFC